MAVEDTDGWIRAAADADLLWLESPSNPLLVVADLRAICAAPLEKPSALLAVDNTFATSLNQRPLDLGADVLLSIRDQVHWRSLRPACRARYRQGVNDLLAALRKSRELHGATPGALESFLAVRGARTMALRLERAQANAMILAERLSSHPGVACTRYPGLEHPRDALDRARSAEGLRHDHFIRCSRRRGSGRRGLFTRPAHSARHEFGCGGVHD